jgi:hypothetical protein
LDFIIKRDIVVKFMANNYSLSLVVEVVDRDLEVYS